MHGFRVVSFTAFQYNPTLLFPTASSMFIICDRDIPVKLKIQKILVKVDIEPYAKWTTRFFFCFVISSFLVLSL